MAAQATATRLDMTIIFIYLKTIVNPTAGCSLTRLAGQSSYAVAVSSDRLFRDPELEWHSVSPRLIVERRLPLLPAGAAALGVLVAAGLSHGGTRWALLAAGAALLLVFDLGWFVVVPRIVTSWAYAERGQDLLVTHGRLRRRLSVVPYGRMQVIEVSANPVSSRLGIATVTLVTASATTDARIPGLPTAEAQALRDRLAAHGEALSAGL